MSENVQLLLIENVFRVACLLVGTVFGYLGYKLYVRGVFDKTQDINAAFGSVKVALRHVAPGVVFGIAGIAIAALSVVRPITLDHSVEKAAFDSTPARSVSTSQPAGVPTPRLLEHTMFAHENDTGRKMRTCAAAAEIVLAAVEPLKACEFSDTTLSGDPKKDSH